MNKADVFDRLATSAPVNATAGKVTSRGSHYEPKFNPARQTWDTPPPMKPLGVSQQQNEQVNKLIGYKFGRLTVLGLFDAPERNREKKSSWVVRCACGKYEIRKAKAIRNPLNAEDRCSHCEATLKKQKDYVRLGSRGIEEFTKPEAVK